MKKFILNADDLGKSEFHNSAVLEGIKGGLLKSASIMANMPSYKDAIYRVAFQSPDLGIGIHLNLSEGKAINQDFETLCDNYGNFNNNFLSLILKSKNQNFLKQVEKEFRSQIELALNDIHLTHLDSHCHIHSIPPLFEIACHLAVEYNIPQIRTQRELPYFLSEKKNYHKYLINQIKVKLLDYFTSKNLKTLSRFKLSTNDFLIGISYTGMMSSMSVLKGLKMHKSGVIEALIHPCLYYDERKNCHSEEFEITKDTMLKDLIEQDGWEIANYIN